jgi:hypothetical protein
MKTVCSLSFAFKLSARSVAMLIAVIGSRSFSQSIWTPAFNDSSQEIPYRMSFGNGKFVGIGSSGIALTSDSGRIWNRHAHLSDQRIRSISNNDSGFVAVGDSGAIYTTKNGIIWETVSSHIDNRLNGVAFGNGVWVTVGEYGTVMRSNDGHVWVAQKTNITKNLNAIAFGDSLFVAVGDSGKIITSHDGVDWTERGSGVSKSLPSVAFGKNRFIALAQDGLYENHILGSIDGKKWTIVHQNVGNGFWLNSVIFARGMFIAADYHGFAKSIDGIAWTPAFTAINYASKFDQLCFGNGTIVILGTKTFGTKYVPVLITSSDTIAWKAQRTGRTDVNLTNVVFGNGVYVAIGESNYSLNSSDAINWSIIPNGPETYRPCYSAFGNGVFVLVNSSGGIWRSVDGSKWDKISKKFPSVVNGLSFSNGMFVAVGRKGMIETSIDGKNWLEQTSGTDIDLFEITGGNGIFLIPDRLISTDGNNWVANPFTRMRMETRFVNEEFLSHDAVTHNILKSKDGVAWEFTDSIKADLYDKINLKIPKSFGNGKYVGIKTPDGLYYSSDLSSFSYPDINEIKIYDVTLGDSAFVAVGDKGAILVSWDESTNSIKARPQKPLIKLMPKLIMGTGKIIIDLSESPIASRMELKIFTASGTTVNPKASKGSANQIFIETSKLVAGLYILELLGDGRNKASMIFVVNN